MVVMRLQTNNRTFKHSLKMLGWLLAIITLLAAAHLLMQYLNLVVYSEQNGRVYELSNRLDFDDEASLPTWFSQFVFLGIAASATLAAYMQRQKAIRRIWGIVALLGLLFAIDETAAIHELLLQTVHLLLFGEKGPSIVANAWVVLLPFIAAAGVTLLLQMRKHLPALTVKLFLVGGVIFMTGAVGLDILTNADAVNTFYAKGILVAIEETLELLGTTTALYAVLQYLESNYATNIKRALAQLRKTHG